LYLLQRSGGCCPPERSALIVIDRLPTISLGEPPGAELSR